MGPTFWPRQEFTVNWASPGIKCLYCKGTEDEHQNHVFSGTDKGNDTDNSHNDNDT